MQLGEKEINSHIQMPRCVLKRFENDHHSFFYYDVTKNIIGSNGHAKTTNTQLGYYSEEVEHYLNDNVEAPFSKVLQFVEQTDFDAPVFQVNNDFSTNVKSFVYALIARDPALLSQINGNSVFYQFLQKQSQHDFAAVEGIRLAQENGFFDTYNVTFSVNKTKKPFVLPVCGIYSYKFRDVIHINLPITPQTAITLLDTQGLPTLIKNDVVSMYLIEEELIVNRFNELAFRAQRNAGWGYVVSPEKNTLKELSVDIHLTK